MFQHDSMFFIGFFIFVFIFWVIVGGPTHPISFSGPLLPGPGALGGGTYLSLPSAPPIIGGVDVGQSHASGPGLGIGSSKLSYKDQEAVTTAIKAAAFGTPSPYKNQVSVSHYISSAGGGNPQNEYLQISLSSSAETPVNLSGWALQSEVTGNRASIPFGTEVPTSGTINAIQPIILAPGDRAIIASGRSPIGASFRENKCIGYFSQFQTFYPSLPNSCPTPTAEADQFYASDLVRDPRCADYVNQLSRCTVVLTPPPSVSGSCQNFLTSYLNYNGCVTAHQNDIDFKSSQWRIYLGRDISMWRSAREVVKLLDTTGKTVDMFTY